MKKLFGFLKKIDDNLLKILLSAFIIFIPLWPKIPIKMIDYTYIAFRYDDVFLTILCFIFLIQLIRKKIILKKTLFIPITLFWLSVFISFFIGFYITKTIEFTHLGLLHSLRRIEYMIVFFIALSVVKTKKDFFQLLNVFFIGVLLTGLYGLGQKFLNFPAVQTMNPEFAKGYLLYLTPEARISSTFAGHYDLASYLVFSIPIILTSYFYFQKKNYLFLFILSLIILIYTSSRISFGAYIISVLGLLIYLRKYWFGLFVAILTVILVLTTGELTKRFLKTFQIRTILVDEKTGAVYIGQKITTKELPAGSFYIKLKDQQKIDNLDTFKEKIIEEKIKLAILSGQINEKQKKELLATLSANLKPVNTVVSDISFATRLQIEWPRAINAFKKSPFFGTGPSSITEATDNDYLRWLGEFGLIGTSLFLFILFQLFKDNFVFINFFKKTIVKNNLLNLGFAFGLIGLLVNATYIDVFEASKVAYSFWIVAGLFMSYSKIKNEKN